MTEEMLNRLIAKLEEKKIPSVEYLRACVMDVAKVVL